MVVVAAEKERRCKREKRKREGREESWWWNIEGGGLVVAVGRRKKGGAREQKGREGVEKRASLRSSSWITEEDGGEADVSEHGATCQVVEDYFESNSKDIFVI